MIQIPRNATLAEALYRDIDKDAYLQEIYGDLLYNYSLNYSVQGVNREKLTSRMHCGFLTCCLNRHIFRPLIETGCGDRK